MSEETKTEVQETEETQVSETESRDAHYQQQIDAMQEKLSVLERDKSDLQVALRQERERRREAKAEVQESPSLDPDKLRSIIREESEKAVSGIRVDVAAQIFDEELDKIAISEKEKELIKLNYRERIRPTGVDRKAIQHDLLLAKAAANTDRIRFADSEGDVSLTTAMSASGGKADIAEEARQFTEEEKKLFAGLGVDPTKTR